MLYGGIVCLIMTRKDLQKEILDLKAQIRKLKKNNLWPVFEDKTEDVVKQCKNHFAVNLVENQTKFTANLHFGVNL